MTIRRLLICAIAMFQFCNIVYASDYVSEDISQDADSDYALEDLEGFYDDSEAAASGEMEGVPATTVEQSNTTTDGVDAVGEEGQVKESAPVMSQTDKLPSEGQKADDKEKADEVPEGEGHPSERVELTYFDTADLSEPKGNWLLKRAFWEYAVSVYEKMWQAAKVLSERRMTLLHALVEQDRKVFIPFYRSVGVGQGELSEVITLLMDQLKLGPSPDARISVERQEFLDMVKEHEAVLEELKRFVDEVLEMDKALNDGLLQVMGQIDKADQYQVEGWSKLKSITHELNDRRAQELYEEMVALLQSMEDILRYVDQEFAAYFLSLQEKSSERVNDVLGTVKLLQEKGIDFKAEFNALIEQNTEEKIDEARRECEFEKQTKEKQESYEQPVGWFKSFFVALYNALMAPFRYLYRLFV